MGSTDNSTGSFYTKMCDNFLRYGIMGSMLLPSSTSTLSIIGGSHAILSGFLLFTPVLYL